MLTDYFGQLRLVYLSLFNFIYCSTEEERKLESSGKYILLASVLFSKQNIYLYTSRSPSPHLWILFTY